MDDSATLDHSPKHRVRHWSWDGLEKLEPVQALLENSFAVWGGFIEIKHSWGKVTLIAGSHADVPQSCLCLDVWLGDTPYDVVADYDLLQDLVTNSGYKQDVRTLSKASLTLVCEHVLAPIMKTIEPILGSEFHVMDAYPAESHSSQGMFIGVVDASKQRRSFGVSLYEESIRSVAKRITKLGEQRTNTHKPISVAHVLSYRSVGFTLKQEEKAELQVGDGLLLSANWSPKQVGQVVLNNCLSIPVQLDEDGLKITGPATSIDPNNKMKASSMTQHPKVNLEVYVELARGRFSLEDLGALREGSILPFPTEVNNQVSLFCNEEWIGAGELVEIDGAFAVRIERTI